MGAACVRRLDYQRAQWQRSARGFPTWLPVSSRSCAGLQKKGAVKLAGRMRMYGSHFDGAARPRQAGGGAGKAPAPAEWTAPAGCSAPPRQDSYMRRSETAMDSRTMPCPWESVSVSIEARDRGFTSPGTRFANGPSTGWCRSASLLMTNSRGILNRRSPSSIVSFAIRPRPILLPALATNWTCINNFKM